MHLFGLNLLVLFERHASLRIFRSLRTLTPVAAFEGNFLAGTTVLVDQAAEILTEYASLHQTAPAKVAIYFPKVSTTLSKSDPSCHNTVFESVAGLVSEVMKRSMAKGWTILGVAFLLFAVARAGTLTIAVTVTTGVGVFSNVLLPRQPSGHDVATPPKLIVLGRRPVGPCATCLLCYPTTLSACFVIRCLVVRPTNLTMTRSRSNRCIFHQS